jgi:serine/threonine protein kinase/beta-lactam-binding protein with PASTA domain
MTEPRRIGNRYELGPLLGYGGMAEVHLGHDIRLGRQVAIKVLRPDLARDPSFQTRFRREAQAAGGLNHPNIVSVYDTGEDFGADGPVPYIVMEFVDGRTLREVLTHENRLEAHRAMEIVAEVCAALDFSHRHGIVHRDIKPGNVMITKTGAVKVMDFGIARALADNAATVTQTASVIGTAQYLSPEQARGETVDARSDVYSTGCLLYELVVGHPPFQGDSPVAVAYQHVRESAAVPSTVNPTIPRALDSIVMKALAKNPLNRYQTAAEMRADLLRAVADRPVVAEPVLSDDERTQMIERSAAAAVPPPRARHRDDSGIIKLQDEEESHGSGRGAVLWVTGVIVLLLVIAGGAYALFHSNGSGNGGTPTTAVAAPVGVPNVVGLTQVVATAQLEAKGLTVVTPVTTVNTLDTCTNQNVKPTQVCAQTPASGLNAATGTKVTLTVYAGPVTVLVPSITGLTQAAALQALTAAKLQGQPTTKNDPAPAGTVLSQGTPANTAVAPNTVITFVVSTGEVVIPDVRGLSQSDAFAKLSAAGFGNVIIGTAQPTNDKRLNGRAYRTLPAAGSFALPSAQITLILFQYQQQVTSTAPTCVPTSPPTSGPPTSGPPTSGPPSSGATTTAPTATPTC